MTQPDRKRLLIPLALLAPTLLLSTQARAQAAWPSQPIRLVVPFPPGGSSDILGRLIADHLGKTLGANFYVDNKPGGTTQIGTDFVAAAPPDGLTLLLGAASSFTVLPHLRKLLIKLGQAAAPAKGGKRAPGGKHVHAKLAADIELAMTEQGLDIGIKGLKAEGLA